MNDSPISIMIEEFLLELGVKPTPKAKEEVYEFLREMLLYLFRKPVREDDE